MHFELRSPCPAFSWSWELFEAEIKLAQLWGCLGPEGEALVFATLRTLEDKLLEITALSTHPRWEGRGLMRTFLRELFVIMRHSGFLLEVHPLNLRARSLYESTGFKLVATRPHYYSDGREALIYRYSPSEERPRLLP